MVLLSLDWMVQDGHRLATCEHDHPFAVLGPQPLEGGGWVVRVWMPEAERVAGLIGELVSKGEGELDSSAIARLIWQDNA